MSSIEVGPWTVKLHARDELTIRGGEVNVRAFRGSGEEGEEPYRSVDVLSLWWTSGKGILTDSLLIQARVSNGEMTGVGGDLALPRMVRLSFKVGAPRRWIEPWVMDCREFGITIGGYNIADLRLGYEQDHGGMRNYYRRKIDAGEPRPRYIGRFALIQGIRLRAKSLRPADRILGRRECTTEVIAQGEALVPMPEGCYPATWQRERRTWRRDRIPWPLDTRTDVSLTIKPGVPVPGKGENSWDIEDDAVCGTGGSTVAAAIGNAVKSALRQRHQYAGPGWTPDDGWPLPEPAGERRTQQP